MNLPKNTDRLSIKTSEIQLLDSLSNRFFKLFSHKQEEFIRLKKILDEFCRQNNLSFSQLSEFLRNIEEYITIPISIFHKKPPLEALTTFLKENLDYTFSRISTMLNRNERTIWTTYKNACKRNIVLETDSEYFIPVSLFKNRQLSVLEIISQYLHEEKKLTFKKISILLGKDQRTIWTCYHRSEKKLK